MPMLLLLLWVGWKGRWKGWGLLLLIRLLLLLFRLWWCVGRVVCAVLAVVGLG